MPSDSLRIFVETMLSILHEHGVHKLETLFVPIYRANPVLFYTCDTNFALLIVSPCRSCAADNPGSYSSGCVQYMCIVGPLVWGSRFKDLKRSVFFLRLWLTFFLGPEEPKPT